MKFESNFEVTFFFFVSEYFKFFVPFPNSKGDTYVKRKTKEIKTLYLFDPFLFSFIGCCKKKKKKSLK